MAIEECRPSEGDFFRDFARFLMARYGCSANRGPDAAVRDLAPTPDDAWEMFWKYVREFRQSQRAEKQQ
jgi:hypothetical protein